MLRFGGWRAALIVFGAFVSFALMGLWEESIQTLGLMLAAVLLSLAIGMPFGVLAGRSRGVPPRDHAGARRDADRARLRLPDADRDPVLGRPRGGRDLHDDLRDPAGGAHHRARHPRRTKDSVEAARAFGSTWAQTLFKVQLPLARRQLLLSVNQTIMFALSLVVIAGLIGGKGLGDVVTNGLYSNAALAILAGIAIVIMAIALDRATAAIAERTDPTRRAPDRRGAGGARRMTLATWARSR